VLRIFGIEYNQRGALSKTKTTGAILSKTKAQNIEQVSPISFGGSSR